MDGGGVWPAIGDRDPAEEVLGIELGVLNEHVEVAILQPHLAQRVEQLVFRLLLAAPPVDLAQIIVGERFLWVLVDHRGVGMGGRVVGIEPVVLDVLAMIALQVGEAKGALFEDAVLAVPEA